MTAWYLAESLDLKLDVNKILKYALVHDLVEIYAGDIDAFMYPGQDISQIKSQNEAIALNKIEKEFPEFPELIQWIKNYEHKADEESLFVYVLDKVLGDFGWSFIYGGTLQECGISEKAMLEKLLNFHFFWNTITKPWLFGGKNLLILQSLILFLNGKKIWIRKNYNLVVMFLLTLL